MRTLIVFFLAIFLSGSVNPTLELEGYLEQLKVQSNGADKVLAELQPLAARVFDRIHALDEYEAVPSCALLRNIDARPVLGYLKALEFKEGVAQDLQKALANGKDSDTPEFTHEQFVGYMRAREVGQALARFLFRRATVCSQTASTERRPSRAPFSLGNEHR